MHRRFLSRRARRAISAVAFLLLFLFLFQLKNAPIPMRLAR